MRHGAHNSSTVINAAIAKYDNRLSLDILVVQPLQINFFTQRIVNAEVLQDRYSALSINDPTSSYYDPLYFIGVKQQQPKDLLFSY